MIRNLTQISITVVLLLSWSSNGLGAEVQFVRDMMGELSKKDPSQIRTIDDAKVIWKWFDFKALFDKASIDFASQMKKEDFEEVREIFGVLMLKNVVKNVHRLKNRGGTALQYALTKRGSNFSIVTLSGRSSDVNISMDFTLLPQGPSSWKISDISVNGALLSRNYRGQFNRIYRTAGVNGLKTRLQVKLASLP